MIMPAGVQDSILISEFKMKDMGAKMQFNDYETKPLSEENFNDILILEEENDDLSQGKRLIDDIEKGNGLDYSFVLSGKNDKGKEELLGYVVGVEDKTDGGKPCIYLEDIAVSSKVQGRGLGWMMMKKLIEKLKNKAEKNAKPLLFNMHLRQSSKKFMDKHKEDLEGQDFRIVDEMVVQEYYSKNENALYRVYEIG